MRTWAMRTAVVLSWLLVACSDPSATTAPISLDSVAVSYSSHEECGPDAVIECPGDPTVVGGEWPYFGPNDVSLRQAAFDPSPGSDGIWLGSNTTPETCFAATGRTITDSDKDWLDDGCEYRVAYAFAPEMLFYYAASCFEGEPYWAAKYFPSSGVVRIAYMPAYYEDCGEYDVSPPLTDHTGDSEFIYVEVTYNATTKHWLFHRMWLSPHYGEGAADRSALVPPEETSFHERYRSHPHIWVASSKHANYKSVEACRTPVVVSTFPRIEAYDRCSSEYNYPVRFPVTTFNNVGSRFVGTQCVPSRGPYAGNGRQECFYYRNSSFRGWQTQHHGNAPPPYYDYLRSEKFESRYGDLGPGPNPPALTVSISGPQDVIEYTSATWTASASHGQSPYTYAWYVDGTFIRTGSTLTRPVGSRGTSMRIEVRATDSAGVVAYETLMIYVIGQNGEIME